MLLWLLPFGLVADRPVAAYNSLKVAKSGIPEWVDPQTPRDRYEYTSSRGDTWKLVMSDEFNTPGRDFRPEQQDFLWTSIEKPDGVANALEYYSHNMTGTKCDDDGTCYLYVQVQPDEVHFRVWNDYGTPPGFQDYTMFYRAGMVQGWNKFCFQGGMLEVRCQLPSALSAASKNPDRGKPANARVQDGSYYPTWPGIWMMGNLGRAIFSQSNDRMWPFSYNECDPKAFDPANQRISACDGDPGHGLNAHQGRGAPEIDLFEGGGMTLSSSIQVAPGMPEEFRLFAADWQNGDGWICTLSASCKTPGSNVPGIPTQVYAARGHKSWYQGLRYAANNFCEAHSNDKQSYDDISRALAQGIDENTCSPRYCPASNDVQGDLGLMYPGTPTKDHWGINSNGTCFPVMNFFKGKRLCSRDNPDPNCLQNNPKDPSPKKPAFSYQMDAISTNWPTHLGVYSGYENFQLEWVMGVNGYLRWSLSGNPIYEIPAAALNSPPQNAGKTNPRKIMMEEPMYLILNVALTTEWAVSPPNAGRACRDHGASDSAEDRDKKNRICDAFPMYLKVDYIRLYQDVSKSSNMSLGCDPASHPTKRWIQDHYTEYLDQNNPLVNAIVGGAPCRTDEDCMQDAKGGQTTQSGWCDSQRCKCLRPVYWGGPRCIAGGSTDRTRPSTRSEGSQTNHFSPSLSVALGFAALAVTTILAFAGFAWMRKKQEQRMVHRNFRSEVEKSDSKLAAELDHQDTSEQELDEVRSVSSSSGLEPCWSVPTGPEVSNSFGPIMPMHSNANGGRVPSTISHL